MLARLFFIESSSKLLVTRTGIKARLSSILGWIRHIILELLALEWRKFHTFELEYLWSQLTYLDQILCVASLGWGKGWREVNLATVFCTFSSRKERIDKWIPISNSLGEETALVNVSISKGCLKCQRVMLSDMPNWGDKVICRYTCCTLQTFVKHYDSTISPAFFQRFPL